MIRNNSISIIFPCFNDSRSIKSLVEDAFEVVNTLNIKHEVIVIDDGSTDSSKNVLKTLAQKYKHLKLVFHSHNIGYGGALRTGFKNATKDLIFYTDGDGQYDVKELFLLYNMMTPDINFVNGIKMGRHDPTYRIVIGNIYSMVVRWLFWLPIYDIDCDFRLIRKNLLTNIHLVSNSGSICVELVKKAQRNNAKFRQVSVHHYERRFGTSQFFRPERLLITLRELLLLWIDMMVINRSKNNKYGKK
jgi:glycosyltransferase involved in cell wall biosynthesis